MQPSASLKIWRKRGIPAFAGNDKPVDKFFNITRQLNRFWQAFFRSKSEKRMPRVIVDGAPIRIMEQFLIKWFNIYLFGNEHIIAF